MPTTFRVTVLCYVVFVLDTKEYPNLILNGEFCVRYRDNRQKNANHERGDGLIM